jgi:hypothetical protein
MTTTQTSMVQCWQQLRSRRSAYYFCPNASPLNSLRPDPSLRRFTQEFESRQGSAVQQTSPIPSGHHQDEDSHHESSEGVEGSHAERAMRLRRSPYRNRRRTMLCLWQPLRTMFQLTLVVVPPRIQHLNKRVNYPGGCRGGSHVDITAARCPELQTSQTQACP